MLKETLSAGLIAVLVQVAHADSLPSDPFFSDQWPLAKLNVLTAWNYSTGSQSVKIAVLDSGIVFGTPDLQGRYLSPIVAETEATDTTAFSPHGTWVSSVIGMTINNGIGGAGTGNFSILPIRITDNSGKTNDQQIVAGINLAARTTCRIINISFSAASYETINNAISAAITSNAAAGRPDFLVFMSAGNSNAFHTLGDVTLDSAAMRAPGDHLIMVGGTDEDDHRWVNDTFNGSDVGPFMDLAAPAHHILVANGTSSTLPYGYASGTSFSAPYAASAAALAFSINPNLTAPQVQNILFDTAFNPNNPNPGTPYWDQTYGWGRVDYAAVAVAAAATVPETASIAIMAVGGLLMLRRPVLRK